ncbi:MAG: integrin alpha, partial [Flavobacteriales bacterium]
YYGSSTWPSNTEDWMGDIDSSSAKYGISVSCAGDVNDDGIDDLIVGAEQFDDGQIWVGAAFVYYGSNSGLSNSFDWRDLSDQGSSKMGSSVSGNADFNNDGINDVVVGAKSYDVDDGNEGKIYVYYGSSSGLPNSPNWTSEGSINYAEMGISVSNAGDVNGDGPDDIIAGAPSFDKGYSFVYYGSCLRIEASMDSVKCFGNSDGTAFVKEASTGNYTYQWEDTSGNILSTNDTAYNLSASKYNITVTDTSTGCTREDSVQVYQPTALSSL